MTPKKSTSSQKKTLKTVKKAVAKTPILSSKKKFSIPPLFSPDTTKEDKMCLLSFCLGMIVMTSFFIIDFQVRSYIDMRQWEDRAIYAMQQGIPMMRNTQAPIIHRGGHIRTPNQMPAKHPNIKITPRTAQFIESEYAPYEVKGDAEIKGNICDSLPKGAVCPQNAAVFINPVTTYSTEWWSKHWAGRLVLSPADKRAVKYNLWTKTEKDGDFEFDDLPAGSYYVATEICVTLNPDKRCVPMRLGKKITVKGETTTTLPIVFRADKP